MLFRVSSVVGIVMLAISLGREMFFEQFRCNIMIDGNIFHGSVDVQRVEGSNILIINVTMTFTVYKTSTHDIHCLGVYRLQHHYLGHDLEK